MSDDFHRLPVRYATTYPNFYRTAIWNHSRRPRNTRAAGTFPGTARSVARPSGFRSEIERLRKRDDEGPSPGR